MTTLVSAFYTIASKRPAAEYMDYVRTFLRTVPVPLVFFTSAELKESFAALDREGITWVVKPLEQMRIFQYRDRAFWQRQCALDPEKAYITPDLAAICANKQYFVLDAIELLMQPSDETAVFLWCDAGCLRDAHAVAAAAHLGTRTAFGLQDHRLHVATISDPPAAPSRCYAFPQRYLSCALLAGTPRAWREYARLYAVCLEEYVTARVGATSDQHVTHTAVDREPERFVLYPHASNRVDPWFKFLEFL